MSDGSTSRSRSKTVKITVVLLALAAGAFFLARWFFGIESIRPLPPPAPPEYALEPVRSETTISLPITIPLKDLEETLAEKVPATFSGEGADFSDRLKNEGWDYEMKRGAITLEAAQDKIVFTIPVSGEARAWADLGRGRREKTVRAKIDIEGTLSGSLAIAIDNQWNVNPDLSLSVRLSKAEIPMGRNRSIDVRSPLTRELNKKIEEKRPELIAAIVNRLVVKGRAEKAWEKLHMVRQIRQAPAVWLRSEPQRIAFKPFDLTDGLNIRTGLGIEILLDTQVREKAPTVDLKPLPDLVFQSDLPGRFSLYIPIRVSFDELNKTLKSKVSGRTFEVAGDASIKVQEISLATLGQRILVTISFGAKKGGFAERVKGKLYLLGRIHYDKASSTLSVVELDYDLNTKETLLSAADWLLKPTVLEEFEKRLSFPLSERLGRAKDEANRMISQFKLPPEFDAHIEIQSIELEKVALTHNAFHFVLLADGTISAALKHAGGQG